MKSVGDLALNQAVIVTNQPGKVFDPKAFYAYTAEAASPALAAKVKAGAGPRVNYCK